MTHHLFHTNFQTEKVQPLKTHLDINKFINQPIYPLKTYSSHSQVTRTSKMSSKGYSLEDRKRHIVKHEYHDHAFDDSSPAKSKNMKPRRGPRGGVTTPFPVKLYNLLQKNLNEEIISWQPHGRCFLLRKPREFLTEVMPLFFKQSKLTSFQRQLNLYGFSRLTSGPDKGGYYHERFLRGKDQLCTTMIRTRIKGTRTKGASDPESEPNFYLMPSFADESSKPYSSTAEDDGNKSATKKQDRTDSRTRSSSCNLRGPQYIAVQTPLKDLVTETSPVCVIAPCSVSSSSRSNSPLTDANIGAPYLPFSRMISKTQTTINPRRAHFVYKPVHYYQPQHQLQPYQCDLSRFPDSISPNDDALTFEGKEFHYLDSVSSSFEDIADTF